MEPVVGSDVWLWDDFLISRRCFPLSGDVRVGLGVFERHLPTAASARVE